MHSLDIPERWRRFRNRELSPSDNTSRLSTDSRSQARNSQISGLTISYDPWEPVVLSLDGGGIRGLSELFILHKIMQRIQEMIDKEGDNPISRAFSNHPGARSAFSRQPKLLPCYFFDYMVGTSTGGLIAVMLGRLRMSVDDSIMEYWILGNDIFRPRLYRYFRLHGAENLEKAINHVTQKHCGSHPQGKSCHGASELLRQYDYAEYGDICFREHPERQNFTCKVALVSQRKQYQSQVTHLFRSYNHSERFENNPREYNPKMLGRSNTKIWEASRATSAAPYYFPSITIGTNEFIDGGAGNNNPSNIAWNEALWMANPLDPLRGKVAALVSLGCGEKEQRGLFGSLWNPRFYTNFIKYAKGGVTNTTAADNETRGLAEQSGSDYFRFSVGRAKSGPMENGLAGVKLGDCKREPKKNVGKGSQEPAQRQGFSSHIDPEKHPARPQWYAELLKEATPQEADRKKGDFKPDKYIYTSYDTIFDGTAAYCASGEDGRGVSEEIDRCAVMLLRRARDRQSNDPERWKCFVSHPSPHHELYLSSSIRPKRRDHESYA
ncbi:acyl transferase/acyl hydrolase/lysophospholipase [Dactylonectria estremocensis]|uniref:Acyl transferase/acyl hydrolase/lysophospholipase n=1 Tax=Dactylonectria estremocensis TaxID=1079267 RepID=A0A9P9EMA2_9HYPO|nr:acyl transferase/acyl hydrolase/lysophospholipase [Dactylonectria estremocensis]